MTDSHKGRNVSQPDECYSGILVLENKYRRREHHDPANRLNHIKHLSFHIHFICFALQR